MLVWLYGRFQPASKSEFSSHQSNATQAIFVCVMLLACCCFWLFVALSSCLLFYPSSALQVLIAGRHNATTVLL